MIELGVAIQWEVATAVRRIQAFDEYAVDWVEKPLEAWDPAGHAELEAKTRALFAYGEKEWKLEGYERVLSTGTCDVVGIDPGRAEGMTGFKRIADHVDAYHWRANAHAWSSAITTTGNLAVSFASPACRLFELKPIDNPVPHQLVAARAAAGSRRKPLSQYRRMDVPTYFPIESRYRSAI